MSDVDELVRWLGEQFDDDERLMRAGMDTPVRACGHTIEDRIVFNSEEHGVPDAIVDCYLRFGDPARVLPEIDSKRRQVAWCVEVIGDRDLSRYDEVGSLKDDRDALAVTLAVETLRLLAEPYNARPGYRAGWAPSE